jgi:hypothetical protein
MAQVQRLIPPEKESPMSNDRIPERRAVLALMTALSAGAAAPSLAAPSRKELPPTAVLRVSRGRFDPARYEEVRAMIDATGAYLVPAISKLPGLIAYVAATTPDGVTTQISVWESAEAGTQMANLPEMRDRARSEAIALGVSFEPILQYPLNWTIGIT